VIAHLGGLPLEEVAPSLTGAVATMVLARAWLMVRVRRRR
jgi:hypothetical protein